ncbi:hypothetical protein, partial [Ureaplasma diversum]|uniref:hypothetical protein n=1 Tax=Ureaplasma diversum TaxID=42094 RepID=UPI000570F734
NDKGKEQNPSNQQDSGNVAKPNNETDQGKGSENNQMPPSINDKNDGSKETEMNPPSTDTPVEKPSQPANPDTKEQQPPTNQQDNDESGKSNSKDQSSTALNTKKQNAKDQINKLNALLNSDKDGFVKQVEAVANEEEIKTIDEILTKAEQKNEERKTKLTPIKSWVDANNYIYFEFKTSQQKYDELKNKKFEMELEVTTKDGKKAYTYDSAGPYSQNLFIIPKRYENGLIVLEMSTLTYFVPETNGREGSYKLIKLWASDDNNKTDLLNESPKEVEISHKKASATA